ncbi:hypothetical protein [Roseobacter weihaiensis]|uniref:hypothetical protein n=1 Tax=Roseobacter weihaiensis TaxID=2763262 RepID=UPI001D0A60E8|nr:hypothetical protein [Roseobacter sp. H9]
MPSHDIDPPLPMPLPPIREADSDDSIEASPGGITRPLQARARQKTRTRAQEVASKDRSEL